uniref:Kinesin-like protein n=1 Tax=Panagrellus redivivus TaxID=6233 RepID=A0A7E4ZSY9_PANRE
MAYIMTQLSDAPQRQPPKRPATAHKETIKVIVRCRPMSQKEIEKGHQRIVTMDTKRGVVEVANPKDPDAPPKTFTFDAIYGENSKQMDLYYETFRDLIESVLNGFNGTIFAYGQTGTGKTFTMEGIRDNPELRGVIPNAIDHIYRHIANSTNQEYLVRASYLEIYQDSIRDLLDKDQKKRLDIRERPDTGVYVKDLTSFVTKSIDEILHVMQVGNANRSIGSTNMNEQSSRSHAIFMITVECAEPGPDGENHIRVGRLNLVDLAGSERNSKTGATGERFKEGIKINLSLSALGNVISALVDGKENSEVPYRDSKLTRLLKDSLGGNSKTVMVANIGPASYNYEETLSTLRYANRAKNIKNKPKINEDPKDALLRQFQDEISRLREMLEKRGSSGNRRRRRRANGAPDSEPSEELNAEEYLKEQQRRLDEEREALKANASIREEEKTRLMDNLEDRQRQLMREQEAQAAVAAKIKAMQSKLLSGNGNLLDQTREQQRLLQQRKIELAEQKRKEREILQQLEAQEDNTAEIHQTFTNLQQEVEVKTKKLQKLFAKLQQTRLEIQDNADCYSKERQQLEQSISEMSKELKLKWLILENFIPAAIVEKIRERAVFDEDQGTWRVLKPGERPSSRESLSLDKSETKMVDSGLGPGISETSTSSEDSGRLATVKRPISLMGLRRPMSSFEREATTFLRQRMRSARTPHAFSSPTPAMNAFTDGGGEKDGTAIVTDTVLRFCGENVIAFSGLEPHTSKVTDYHSVVAAAGDIHGNARETEQRKTNQSVIIEVTKIPAPRSASRDARAPATNIRRLSTATPSKNARARSAHGRAIGSPVSPAGSQGSAGSAGRSTPPVVFPKARGLVAGAAKGRRL